MSNTGFTALSTEELARIAEGKLIGSGDIQITGIAEIATAGSNDVTYAVNARYVQRLADCAAAVAIVPRGSEIPPQVTMAIIEADNPYWSFAVLLEKFAPSVPEPKNRIHPSAVIAESAIISDSAIIAANVVIEDNVKIGNNTVIEASCYIGYGCEIGADCQLYPAVRIMQFCTLADRVKIHSGTVIGTDGYGFVHHKGSYRKIPQIGIVEIQSDVEIGSLVCIDRATIGRTVIGKGSKLDNLIQIGHNVELGENCALVSQVGISGSTKIGDNCRFAGQAATSGHLRIGTGTTVAARGVVTKDLPPSSFVSGFPARSHREEQKTKAALTRLPSLIKRMARVEKELELKKVKDHE